MVAGLVAAVALLAWRADRVAAGPVTTDLPRQGQFAAPGEATAAAELEQHLQRHPDDARALVLKARLDMREERFDLAAAGFRKALAASWRVAKDASVWAEAAEALGMAQGGSLVGPPEPLVAQALAVDATNPRALDLAASAAWERGDFAAAARHWRRLLEQIAPDGARRAELSAAIEAADRRARFALPDARR